MVARLAYPFLHFLLLHHPFSFYLFISRILIMHVVCANYVSLKISKKLFLLWPLMYKIPESYDSSLLKINVWNTIRQEKKKSISIKILIWWWLLLQTSETDIQFHKDQMHFLATTWLNLQCMNQKSLEPISSAVFLPLHPPQTLGEEIYCIWLL